MSVKKYQKKKKSEKNVIWDFYNYFEQKSKPVSGAEGIVFCLDIFGQLYFSGEKDEDAKWVVSRYEES